MNQDSGRCSFSAFTPHEITLAIRGPVDQQMSASLTDHLKVATEDYKYSCIHLDIESPGGNAQMMRQMVREMLDLKARGIELHTTARTLAASAGALMLCLGSFGHRTAYAEAMVLLHHCRMLAQPGTPMTADQAEEAQRGMKQADEWVINKVVDELIDGNPSEADFFDELSRRAERMVPRYDKLSLEFQLESPKADQRRDDRKVLKLIADLAGKPVASARREYGNAPRKEFARDRRMNLCVAYALGLIDQVDKIDLAADRYLPDEEGDAQGPLDALQGRDPSARAQTEGGQRG